MCVTIMGQEKQTEFFLSFCSVIEDIYEQILYLKFQFFIQNYENKLTRKQINSIRERRTSIIVVFNLSKLKCATLYTSFQIIIFIDHF